MATTLLSRATTDNPKWQLIGTAIISGAFVAVTILGFQRLSHEERVWELKHSIPDPREDDPKLHKLTRIGTMTPSTSRAHSDASAGTDDDNSLPAAAAAANTTTAPISLTSTTKDSSSNNTDSASASQTQSPPATEHNNSTHLPFPPTKEDQANALLAQRAQKGDFDPSLIQEQLARTSAFLQPAGLARLRTSFVIIVGLGGVGSHATAALARSGVSRLRLVDFDQVTLSSLNRHAFATLADVGVAKVGCVKRRLEGVVPWCRIDGRVEKFDKDSADRLLGGWEGELGDDVEGLQENRMPDFVIDAIDNIDTKVALLKYCHDHGIPVVSAMGAGCKSDPTRIVVGDISSTTDDALSKSTRRKLKLLGVSHGIATVFSTERLDEKKAQLLPLNDEEFKKGSVGDLGVLPDFRVRILPVLGTMPAVFGYTIANHVILQLTGYPTEYIPTKISQTLIDRVHAALQSSEERLVRAEPNAAKDAGVYVRLPITSSDISFLVEDIYRGRSAISGLPSRLVLARWRKPEGGSILVTSGEGKSYQKTTRLALHDLVCMTKEEAIAHEAFLTKENFDVGSMYSADTVQRVEKRLQEILEFEKADRIF